MIWIEGSYGVIEYEPSSSSDERAVRSVCAALGLRVHRNKPEPKSEDDPRPFKTMRDKWAYGVGLGTLEGDQ